MVNDKKGFNNDSFRFQAEHAAPATGNRTNDSHVMAAPTSTVIVSQSAGRPQVPGGEGRVQMGRFAIRIDEPIYHVLRSHPVTVTAKGSLVCQLQ